VSLLAIGLSHRTTEVELLEQAAIPADLQPKLLDDLLACSHVTEAMVLSTCNRVEIYTVVDAFHAGLSDVTAVLSRHAGIPAEDLFKHLYVHYASGAVNHVFNVAAGLDSMVVGEAQILGQLRSAYAVGKELGTVGSSLHEVIQNALRVGKRVHSETDIDHVGASVVGVALEDAHAVLGDLTDKRAVLIGAGAMGGLSAAALRRSGVAEVTVANRTQANGQRLANALKDDGVNATAVGLGSLSAIIATADLVITCTGASSVVVDVDVVGSRTSPIVFCDLGLPRDIAAEVAGLDNVTVVDLVTLQQRLSGTEAGENSATATKIVADEVQAYLSAQRSSSVTPTVTALRKSAAKVVDSELLRLDSRLPDLDESTRAEITKTVRRVVDKLLHTPTVRVKELAAAPGGDGYADALRELFALDPATPAMVTSLRGDEIATLADQQLSELGNSGTDQAEYNQETFRSER
jgi:glutamyl-tRNA reductase